MYTHITSPKMIDKLNHPKKEKIYTPIHNLFHYRKVKSTNKNISLC